MESRRWASIRAWLMMTCGNSERPSSTSWMRPVRGVGPPEGDLVDPVALGDQPVGQAERLEHLHRAAGDTVGLAHLERAVPAVDDRRPDVGEVGELGGEDEAGGAAPDDQDVDLLGETLRAVRDGGMRLLHERVAGPIAVEVELHVVVP